MAMMSVDQGLRTVAPICQACPRATDVLARMGGEKCIVYCPDTILEVGWWCGTDLTDYFHLDYELSKGQML